MTDSAQVPPNGTGPAVVPRRVLMTADAVGGVWTYAVDMARELTRRGAQVTLAVMGPSPDTSQRASIAALPGVTLVDRPYRLEWMADPWDDVAAAGAWLREVERTAAPDIVHLNGYVHAALDWHAPTVVVGHSCVLSWWRAVHGDDAPREWDAYRDQVRRGLHSAAVVVAPTTAMLKALRDHYGPLERGRVIANGRCADGAPGPTARARESFVLSAGRVWDRAKNIESVCRVAAELSWPVVVAGELRPPGGEPQVFTGVRCLGRVDPAVLRSWMHRAAIYALPARYEPFGLSVLEAATAGCALVLGDIDSLRELWDGAAMFVAPDNRSALTTMLERLIHDKPLRLELGKRARQRAEHFSAQTMADEYCDAYRSVLPLAAV